MYDIRKLAAQPAYSDFFVKYLNLPETQKALGIEETFLYEPLSDDVYAAFQQSGDYVYPDYMSALGQLLDSGIRVV